MNIVVYVDVANIPEMCLQILDIIRVLHIDITMQPGIEIYSVGKTILRHAIKFTCQKCEIIQVSKTPIRRAK